METWILLSKCSVHNTGARFRALWGLGEVELIRDKLDAVVLVWVLPRLLVVIGPAEKWGPEVLNHNIVAARTATQGTGGMGSQPKQEAGQVPWAAGSREDTPTGNTRVEAEHRHVIVGWLQNTRPQDVDTAAS